MFGKLFYPDGSVYLGEMYTSNDGYDNSRTKKQGLGVFSAADGTSKSGLWDNDELSQSLKNMTF